MTRRSLPQDPRQWTPDERAEVTAVHRTFTETPQGRRAFEIIKRDLWDNMSATAPGPRGEILLDDRTTMFNEGRRAAFERISSYVEAYVHMTTEGGN